MELAIEGNEDLMSVRIIGPLDASNCQSLRETILELTDTGRKHIQINLADTPMVDTSGIGVLIGIKTAITRRGGTFQILSPQPQVRETLEMMRLDKVLGIEAAPPA